VVVVEVGGGVVVVDEVGGGVVIGGCVVVVSQQDGSQNGIGKAGRGCPMSHALNCSITHSNGVQDNCPVQRALSTQSVLATSRTH
jgi:hypothetical protein